MRLASGLSILFIFSKNQVLALLIFAIVPFISFSIVSALISMIFLLLTLGFFIPFFPARLNQDPNEVHTLYWLMRLHSLLIHRSPLHVCLFSLLNSLTYSFCKVVSFCLILLTESLKYHLKFILFLCTLCLGTWM